MKRLIALLLITGILIMCCSCSNGTGSSLPARDTPSSDNPGGSHEISITRPLVSEEQQSVNAAAASAVRAYVEARIKTDAFVAADFTNMTDEETTQMIDGLAKLWSLALEQAEAVQSSAAKLLSTSGKSGIKTILLAADAVPTSGNNIDAEKWAENLTKQYDAIKGSNTVKQLAAQLGVDAKTAYAQLTLAQDIIRSGADKDAAYFDKLTKVAQVTKTACKVGLFVTATIATGGGTLGTLAASSMTIGQAGAVIVGGTDCIVDVATTGSTILLGEGNQVTIAAENLKDKIAPMSAVVGLVTFNSSSAGEQISYIGETLSDWFSEGKILGVKVTDNSDGMSVMAKAIITAGMNPGQIAQELQKFGFVAPLATVPDTPSPSTSATAAPATPDVSATSTPSAVPSQSATPYNGTLTADEISGAYNVTVKGVNLNKSFTANFAVSGNNATFSSPQGSMNFTVSGNTLTAEASKEYSSFVITFSRANGSIVGDGTMIIAKKYTVTYTFKKIQ